MDEVFKQQAGDARVRVQRDLDSLLCSTEIAALLLDEAHRLLSFTPAATELYELSEGDFGSPLEQLPHRALAMPPLPDIAALGEGKAPTEALVETVDGRFFRRRVRLWRSRSGQPKGLGVTYTDVTELQRLQHALRESEMHSRLAAEAADFGIYDADLISGEVYWSGHMKRIFGLAEDAPVPVAAGDVLAFIHPEDRQRADAALRRALSSQGDGVLDEQHRVIRPDGQTRWVMVRGRTQFAEEGSTRRAVRASGMIVDITERPRTEPALRETAVALQTINRVNLSLASELGLEPLLQAITDAATGLSGAGFGAFFYNETDEHGDKLMLYTLSGAAREAFEKFPMPRKTPVFEPTFTGKGIVRSDDITQDARYGKVPPHYGMPQGHPAVRSYLAVPVVSRSTEVHGGLFLGHPQPGVFTERAEQIVSGIAAQAAIAIDHARLYENAREREERFRIIVERLPAAFYICDASGRLTLFNRAAAVLWGREPRLGSDMWGGSWKVYTPDGMPLAPDQRPMAVALRERRALKGQAIMIERPSGERRHVLAHPEPIFSASGEIIGALNMLVDITERQQVEAKLRESEQRYRAIFEMAGVSVWEEDFSAVKQALEALSAAGVTDFRVYFEQHPEFVRRAIGLVRIVNVNEETLRLFAAESKAQLLLSLETVLVAESEAVFVQELLAITEGLTFLETETLVRTLDGRKINVLFSIRFPVETGDFRRVVVTLTDITLRKQAERALHKNEQFLRRVLDNLFAFVGVTTPEGRLIEINRAPLEAAAIAKDDVIGRLLWDSHWWSYAPEVQAQLRDAVERANSGKVVRYDVQVRMAGDTRMWVDFQLAPLYDDEGRITHLIPSAMDLTVRKQVEQRLLEADRHKDEFIAVLAHELRNPLAPVRNAVYLLELAELGDEKLVQMRDIIKRQVAHMGRLLDDLLDVSRVSRGKVELKRQRIDLLEVVRITAEDLRGMFQDRGIGLSLELPDEAWAADVDPARIAQCVGNILHNALKFTDAGGQVRLTATRDGDEAVIVIRDTGIGMAADFVECLFEPFRQADRSLHRSAGGLGLGLAMVKGLVELHGGRVYATSGGLGQGSVFVIRLPLAAPP